MLSPTLHLNKQPIPTQTSLAKSNEHCRLLEQYFSVSVYRFGTPQTRFRVVHWLILRG